MDREKRETLRALCARRAAASMAVTLMLGEVIALLDALDAEERAEVAGTRASRDVPRHEMPRACDKWGPGRLDEIERRIPSRATECAYCYRLATAQCPVCGAMACEDHRAFHARDSRGTDCEGVGAIPAHHDVATMDRVALVGWVRRLWAERDEA